MTVGLLLFVLAPLPPNHYFPWVNFQSEFTAFIALLFTSIYTISLKPLSIPNSAIFILVIALVPLIQFGTGLISFWGDAYISSIYIVGLAAAVIIGTNFGIHSTAQSTLYLACGLFLSAIFSTFTALYQWLDLSYLHVWIIDLPPEGRPYGNLGQPNNLALLVSLGLASLLYLYESRTISSISSVMAGSIFVLCLVLTASKTPWLIMFVFCCWWLVKNKTLNTNLKAIHIAGWIFFYIALRIFTPIFFDFLYFEEIETKAREISATVRPIMWRQFFDAISGGPIWGFGWNQVSQAHISVATNNYPLPIYAEYSHNILLDIFIWNGPILGLIILLAVSYWAAVRAASCNQTHCWYLLFCVAASLAHAMVEYPHTYSFFLLPIGISIGIIESSNTTMRSSIIRRSPLWLNTLAVGLCTILAIITFKEYRLIEEDGRLARFESAKIGLLKSENLAPEVKLLTQLQSRIAFIRSPAKPNMPEQDINWMGNLAHRYAYPPVLSRYILVLLYNEKPKEALLELEILRGLHGETEYNNTLKLIRSKGLTLNSL